MSKQKQYFQGSENTMYEVMLIDTCCYTFIETHRIVEPKEWTLGDYDLPTQVHQFWQMLIMGEAMYVWGQEVYGNSLYPPLNFVMNLKVL